MEETDREPNTRSQIVTEAGNEMNRVKTWLGQRALVVDPMVRK